MQYKSYVLPGPPSKANLLTMPTICQPLSKPIPPAEDRLTRPNLIILRLRMAVTPKLRRLPQQATSKPRTVSLPLVAYNLHLHATALRARVAPRLRSPDTVIDHMLDIPLQPASEIAVERRPAREDNVLVEALPYIDGRGLDDAIHDNGERGQEVGGVDLRVEEDLGGEEALVADVDDGAFAVGVRDGVFREAGGVFVEFGEFFDHVRADVAVFFFYPFGGF